jgi:hypothetical protein
MSQSAKNNGFAADRQQKSSSPLRFRSGGKEKEK